MSYHSYTRLTGIVTIAAGAAVIIFNAFLLPKIIPASWEYPGYLTLNILLVFALTALYTFHLKRSSVLLHLGYALSAVGLFLSIGFSFYAVFAFPTLRAQFPDAVGAVLSGPMNTALLASMLLGVVGNLLFYVALLLAREIPRWAAIVLITAAVLSIAMLPYNIPALLASIGLIGAGVSMVSPGNIVVAQAGATPAD
ncbi:MAG: hypothetical protein EHM21_09780 [Chloroflexi bacterium]|nr:MAG: hypothetical protein EHM21_09780 [Chloroflexota bacterium]